MVLASARAVLARNFATVSPGVRVTVVDVVMNYRSGLKIRPVVARRN